MFPQSKLDTDCTTQTDSTSSDVLVRRQYCFAQH